MSLSTKPPMRGVSPVVPTVFDERGDLDLDEPAALPRFHDRRRLERPLHPREFLRAIRAGRRRARDDHGTYVLKHVAGRVPVIVTTTHFSSPDLRRAQPARRGRGRGHGDGDAALSRRHHPGRGGRIFDFLRRALGRDRHPHHDPGRARQRHALSAAFLARMAREIEHVCLFQDRGAAAPPRSSRELIRLGGDSIVGPWDGEEAITLMADLDAGATGAMPSGGYPDGLRPIVDDFRPADATTRSRLTSAGCR